MNDSRSSTAILLGASSAEPSAGALGAPAEPSAGALGADLLAAVSRLNRWATRQADLPIPPAQGRLLAQIDELGPARIGDLARADHSSQPTMTSQVRRLIEGGWVTRQVDPDDRRAVLVSLSSSGRRLLSDVRAARALAVAPLVERLSPQDRDRLHDALELLGLLLRAAAYDDSGEARPRTDQHETAGKHTQ